MADRLGVIRRAPQALLEWEPTVGGGSALLARAYPQARRLRVQALAVPAPAAAAAPWWSFWRRDREAGEGPSSAAGSACTPEQVPPGEAGLVWANMVLHGSADPPQTLQRWLQALQPEGFLMFSTLGPGTLGELRELYAQAGWGPPMAPLVDMHDIGDMLVRAGFADPVMDQETLTLTWPDPEAALAELRTLGANVEPARFAGLRTRAWRARLVTALQQLARARPDARVALDFEIVYGHAFKVEAPPRLAPETTLTPQALQRLARQGRHGG